MTKATVRESSSHTQSRVRTIPSKINNTWYYWVLPISIVNTVQYTNTKKHNYSSFNKKMHAYLPIPWLVKWPCTLASRCLSSIGVGYDQGC